MTWSNLSKADFEKNPNHYADRIPRIPLGQAGEAEEQADAILFSHPHRPATFMA